MLGQDQLFLTSRLTWLRSVIKISGVEETILDLVTVVGWCPELKRLLQTGQQSVVKRTPIDLVNAIADSDVILEEHK